MVNYVKLADTANRLITKNGRDAVFETTDKTPSDPAQPWKGSNVAPTPTTFKVVMVPPNTVRQFGLTALGQGTEYKDLIKFSEQILILFPGTNDMRSYAHVQDGGVRWTVIGVQLLQPADTQLLAFVGVRR